MYTRGPLFIDEKTLSLMKKHFSVNKMSPNFSRFFASKTGMREAKLRLEMAKNAAFEFLLKPAPEQEIPSFKATAGSSE